MASSITQTTTPYKILTEPDKDALVQLYANKPLSSLRTPAFIINRDIFAKNCDEMHRKAREWGAHFRAHVKTHKTAEGTRHQLITGNGRTNSVVVSTLAEAWGIVKAGLTKDGVVRDILYGLPPAINKIQDLSDLWDEIAVNSSNGIVRLLIDHPKQIEALEIFERQRTNPRRWSVFIKIDGGQSRAGVSPTSVTLGELLDQILSSTAINLHGFYSHAGNAYASTSLPEATSHLSSEVSAVNAAAEIALDRLPKSPYKDEHSQPFILSVGSTPTAHAAGEEARNILAKVLHGALELHAGNYPLLDLQQQHTSLIDSQDISQRVRATIISFYPGRGEGGQDEALIDAGALAFSKDTGPSGSYGAVIGRNWDVGRISQEHGILIRTTCRSGINDDILEVGDQVEIVGQHACLIAAGYPWYYIVEGPNKKEQRVVDVWVPWKGW